MAPQHKSKHTTRHSSINAARARIREVKACALGIEERIEIAQDLAGLILDGAKSLQTNKEKKREAELAKMIQDPNGKALMSAMLDSCFRTSNATRLVDQIRRRS